MYNRLLSGKQQLLLVGISLLLAFMADWTGLAGSISALVSFWIAVAVLTWI